MSRNLFLLMMIVLLVVSTSCASKRHFGPDPVASDDSKYVMPTAKRIK